MSNNTKHTESTHIIDFESLFIYNTTSNESYSGCTSYYMLPEKYEELMNTTNPDKSKSFAMQVTKQLNALSSAIIIMGRYLIWDTYDEMPKERWNYMYEIDGDNEWFFLVQGFGPEYGDFMKNGVVCSDPWQKRLELIEHGYVEISSGGRYGVEKIPIEYESFEL